MTEISIQGHTTAIFTAFSRNTEISGKYILPFIAMFPKVRFWNHPPHTHLRFWSDIERTDLVLRRPFTWMDTLHSGPQAVGSCSSRHHSHLRVLLLGSPQPTPAPTWRVPRRFTLLISWASSEIVAYKLLSTLKETTSLSRYTKNKMKQKKSFSL